MWFIRGLFCFTIASVLLQAHGSHGFTSPENHLNILITDTINAAWTKLVQCGLDFGKYILTDPDSVQDVQTGRAFNEEDLDKVIGMLSVVFPAERTGRALDESGRGMDSVYNVAMFVVDYITNAWRQIKSSMWDRVDSVMEWNTMFTNWFSAPLEIFFSFLFKSPSRRARSVNAIFDHVNKIWLVPTRKLFAAIVNVQADMLRGFMMLSKGARTPGSQRSMVVAGLYDFKEEFMKFSGHNSGNSQTIYGQKHHLILAELSKRDFSLLNELVNLLMFVVWSGTGFLQVYKEMLTECYRNRDVLEYTLIEGETYVDDSSLHTIMENANANRKEACTYYRTKAGQKDSQRYSFVAAQFSEMLASTYENLEPMSADIVVVDAVAQSILGPQQHECILYTLCMAGLSKLSFNQHPGVDLLLGIVVSGRANFGGLLKEDVIRKIGTPKMAEAIYRGFHKECNAYQPPDTVDCSNVNMFLSNFEERQQDEFA